MCFPPIFLMIPHGLQEYATRCQTHSRIWDFLGFVLVEGGGLAGGKSLLKTHKLSNVSTLCTNAKIFPTLCPRDIPLKPVTVFLVVTCNQ